MPALLPIFLIGTHFILASNDVPRLNYAASCKAASGAGLVDRDEDACRRDEEAAREKLKEQWQAFNAEQRRHCLALSTLGGSPSYVEFLTCLEMARDAANLKSRVKPTEEVEE